MEHVTLKLGQPDEYDRAVHGDDAIRSLPQGSAIELITKDNGTVGGNGIAVLCWTTEIDGKVVRCQATTTVGLLQVALAGLNGRYKEGGKLREHLRGQS
jgi:hypothetical protein